MTSLILSEKVNQENINSLKKDVLENLIQLKLKKIELSKYNIKKDDLQTQVYLKSISPSNNVENLKDILKKNNLSYELFLSEIEIELMWQKFIYKIYSNKINIDEKEIVKELEKKLENTSKFLEFNLSEIELTIKDFDKEKDKILNIQKSLNNETFESVARKFSNSSNASEGGNLGWINSQSLSGDIIKSITKLKRGEISDQ